MVGGDDRWVAMSSFFSISTASPYFGPAELSVSTIVVCFC